MSVMSFDCVKDRVIAAIPRRLEREVTTGRCSLLVHLASFENIRRWHAENPCYAGCTPATVTWKEAMKEILRVIAAWDVRQVRALVDLVPYALPAWVANGRYDLELGDGVWYLVAKGGR